MQDHDTYRIADGRRGAPPRGTPPHPAGWLTDPLGRHEIRYWDGWEWTAHVSDAGIPATDPVPAGAGRVGALPVPRRLTPVAAGDRLLPTGTIAGPQRTLWPWLVVAATVILLAVIVAGTGGTARPAEPEVRVARRATPVPTVAARLPVADCQRIVLEVQAGIRAMTVAGYRRVCGPLPEGVVLGAAPTTAAGAIEAARRP